MISNFYLKIMKYALLDFVLLTSFFLSLASCWSLRKVRFQSRYYYLEVHGLTMDADLCPHKLKTFTIRLDYKRVRRQKPYLVQGGPK